MGRPSTVILGDKMAVAVGKPVSITLETHDGEIINLTGKVTHFQVSQGSEVHLPYDTMDAILNGSFVGDVTTLTSQFVTTQLEIRGESISHRSIDDARSELAEEVAGGYWNCPYCGLNNPMSSSVCGDHLLKDNINRGCGAVKPLKYG